MRKPTPIGPLYSWHAEALGWYQARGSMRDFPGEINETPHCGFYKRRMVRGGPWIAARIWLHQEIESGELVAPEELRCEVGGKTPDVRDQWSYLASHPITEAEFRFLRDTSAWAKRHAPDEPAANEHLPVDHLKTPLAF